MVEIGPAVEEAETRVESNGELDARNRIYIPAGEKEFSMYGKDFMLVIGGENVPNVPVSVSEPGQFTVPRVVRRVTGLSEGDTVEYELREIQTSEREANEE